MTYMDCKVYVVTPVKIFCDNQTAIELTKNAMFHKRSKHIDISYHYTRELVEKSIVKIDYISTQYMIADILTKSLPKSKHQNCLPMLDVE